jgi:hypothetical protein
MDYGLTNLLFRLIQLTVDRIFFEPLDVIVA